MVGRVGLYRKNSIHTIKGYGRVHHEPGVNFLCKTMNGASETPKIAFYDFQKLVNFSAIMTLFHRGTIFSLDRHVYVAIFAYFAVFAVSAACVASGQPLVWEKDSLPQLLRISDNLQRFCPFLFGLFTSLILSRWWGVRCLGVGPLEGSIVNISGLLAATAARVLTSSEDWEAFKKVHARLVRYGAACLMLISIESRGSSLDDLMEMELVSADEKRILEGTTDHLVTLWCWIQSIAVGVCEKLKMPPPNFNMVYQEARGAMNGIHTLRYYMSTQLPFPYVHMIILIVNVHNLTMACVAGMKFAIEVHKGGLFVAFAELFQVLLLPLLYQGLLQVCVTLADPLGPSIIDLPITEYYVHLISSCTSQLSARALYDTEAGRELDDLLAPLQTARV